MNKIIEKIKEKYNKSNKYVLYLDYNDIGLLFKYIEKIERKYKDLFFQNFELWEKNIFPMKENRGDKMGHDLDDEELKATKNKFYNLNKIEKNNKVHIPMVYTPLHFLNFINKIDVVLFNSNSSDIGVSHSEYINIINELHKLYNDYSSLYYRYFTDLNNNHIPHID